MSPHRAAAIQGKLATLGASRPWTATSLARVFAVDIMTCSRCGGRMRLVETADSRDDGLVSPASDFGDLFGCRPGQRVKVKLTLAVMDVDAIEDAAMDVEAERGVGESEQAC